MSNPPCPILDQAQAVLTQSKDLYKALRKFRRAQNKCKDCEYADSCEPIKDINQQINTALVEITEEWNLSV